MPLGPRTGQQSIGSTGDRSRWDLGLYEKSRGDASSWRSLHFLVGMLLVVMVPWSPAEARDRGESGEILWLIAEGDQARGEEVLAGVREALGSGAERHLIGVEALAARVERRSRPLPGCAFGLEGCGGAEAMAFDALGLGLLVRLEVYGRSDSIEVNYEMVDRRGSRADTGWVQGATPREVGFSLVGELFDAVGVVSFESEPSGATVFLGEEAVGTTPMSRQMGLGGHRYRMELEAHRSVEGEVEVRSGEAHRIGERLRPRPGRLAIQGAPEGAAVWIDDQRRGVVVESLELLPGQYAVEIRAEGYQPFREQVEINVDEVRELKVELEATGLLQQEVSRSAVRAHRFQFDLGAELGFQLGTFTNARGRGEEMEYGFEGWLDGGELGDQGNLRRFLSPGGLRVGAGWEGERFGLTVLSLSVVGQQMAYPARVRTRDGIEIDGRVVRYQNVEIRPMQVRYRFFYEDLVPVVQAGLGLAVQRADFEMESEEVVRLRQVSPFGALEAGVRYHLTPWWSVGGAYRFSFQFGSGMSSEHQMGIFMGFGLREVPGLNLQPPEAL